MNECIYLRVVEPLKLPYLASIITLLNLITIINFSVSSLLQITQTEVLNRFNVLATVSCTSISVNRYFNTKKIIDTHDW